MTAKADPTIGTMERFRAKGRVVLTASDAMQYSFEGDDVSGNGVSSVFTRHLVKGLETGDADRDGDGDVSLDELYDYVDDHVTKEMPSQRPRKKEWDVEGRIVVAHNPRPAGVLPRQLQEAIDSPFPGVRQGAVNDLERFLRTTNAALAIVAERALQDMLGDDSRTVVEAASRLLRDYKLKGQPVLGLGRNGGQQLDERSVELENAVRRAQASEGTDRSRSAKPGSITLEARPDGDKQSLVLGQVPPEAPDRAVPVVPAPYPQRLSVSGALAMAAGGLRFIGSQMPNKSGKLVLDRPSTTSYILSFSLILLGLALVRPTRWRSFTPAIFVGMALASAASTFNAVASPWAWPLPWRFEGVDYPYLLGALLLVIAVATVLSAPAPTLPSKFGTTTTRLIFIAVLVALVVFGPYNNVYGLSTAHGQPYGEAFPFMNSPLGWAMAVVLGLFLCVYVVRDVARRSPHRASLSVAALIVATGLVPAVVFAIYPRSVAAAVAAAHYAPSLPYVIGQFVPVVGTLSILFVGFVAQLSSSRYGATMIGAWAIGTDLQLSQRYAVYSVVVLAIVALGMAWLARGEHPDQQPGVPKSPLWAPAWPGPNM
jgi:hypothetical protein